VVLYARIGIDATDGTLKVENYTAEPIQLVDVAKQK
jgi:hypothetical protein